MNPVPDDKAADAGDHLSPAVGAVIAEFQAPLLRYAARLTNDASAAQDVVQNAFIKLVRNWKPESHGTPQLSVWLYRVVHNEAVDYIRSENRRRLLGLKHSEEIEHADPGTAAHRTGARAEKAASFLRTLSIREQQIVILKIYEEKSYKEISRIAGVSEGNVGYILHNAMRKLADLMKQAEKAESAGPQPEEEQ